MLSWECGITDSATMRVTTRSETLRAWPHQLAARLGGCLRSSPTCFGGLRTGSSVTGSDADPDRRTEAQTSVVRPSQRTTSCGGGLHTASSVATPPSTSARSPDRVRRATICTQSSQTRRNGHRHGNGLSTCCASHRGGRLRIAASKVVSCHGKRWNDRPGLNI
jgi:hypothetical protein